jgi:cell wall-associated NlpC family hydrolase
MVGSKTTHVLWVLVLCVLTSAALAQRTPNSTAKHPVEASTKLVRAPTSPRLLTPDEGLAIIGAALETRYRTHSNGDCSHLVHVIYEQAGFPYRYADSSQLYNGIEDFRRVTHAQPGDLAVWRGHAAIVINPAQHSFFSSTRSGLRVESYDSGFWKRRGPPRFFRYVKPASSSSPSITRTANTKRPALRNKN